MAETLDDDLIAAQLPQLQLEAQVLAEFDKSARSRHPNVLNALDASLLDSKQKRKLDNLKAKISSEYPGSKRSRQSLSTELNEGERGCVTDEFVEIPVFPGLRMRRALYEYLYPFQREGVEFLAGQLKKNAGGLLAHDLGLGKTLQTVALVGSVIESGLLEDLHGRVLVVCPATLVSQWVKEFSDFFRGKFLVSSASEDPSVKSSSVVHVAAYETVRNRREVYDDGNFVMIVADEAHRLRNPFSKTTEVLKSFRTPMRIALSGTPIQNNLQELWSIMDFVRPGVLGSLAVFNEELAKAVEIGCRVNASLKQAQHAYRAALLITQLIDPYMHKKTKLEVQNIINLPEKHEQVLFVHMDYFQYAIYTDFLIDAQFCTSAKVGHLFKTVAKLRKLANHASLLSSDVALALNTNNQDPLRGSGKLQVLLRLLLQWRIEGERALVFSQSLKMLDIIEDLLKYHVFTYARVDGSTSIAERNRLIDLFGGTVSNETATCPQVLLLSTKVFGVGTNLQSATRVVIVCPSWNVADDAQARDRSWRIGQQRPVEVYRLISVGTIEELVYKRQIYKQHLSQKILLDPRQQGDDLFSDLRNDIYKFPPVPPGYDQWISNNRALIDAVLNKTHGPLISDSEDEDITKHLINSTHNLVAAVWNQGDVETPLLNSALVDAAELNAIEIKARKAIQESSSALTQLPELSSVKSAVLTAVGRSKSLLTAIQQPDKEDTEMASSIRSWFQSRRKYRATSEEVLQFFSQKIPANKQLLFRACLKNLCRLHHGIWTLQT